MLDENSVEKKKLKAQKVFGSLCWSLASFFLLPFCERAMEENLCIMNERTSDSHI
jgi:hypothetical protein